MKRLLIIGASMPLPTDELSYDETWPFLLKKEFKAVDIVDKCIRARSVRTLMHGGPSGDGKNLFEWYHPDFVIIHLGLSDCAPRLLPRNSIITKLINHSPFSKGIYSILRKFIGRRIEYADVSPKEFRDNLEKYLQKTAPIPIGIIKISRVTETTLKRSPKFNDAIDQYNSIIDKVALDNSNATIINGLDATDISCYQTDGIHLSSKGQMIIFERCRAYITSLLNT